MMRRNWMQVAYGAATRVPGVLSLRDRMYRLTDPGTVSARYCYSVWMRHLSRIMAAGATRVPPRIVELGPGNSIGIGIAALLTGAERYRALDVVSRVSAVRNLAVFDELVRLVRRRAPVPGIDEFPAVQPLLDDQAFPRAVLTDEVLARALEPARLEALRAELTTGLDGDPAARVGYLVPWDRSEVLTDYAGRFDLVLSQAALEHVDDIDATYARLALLLRPGGVMSHQVDYKHHGTALRWNGHWVYRRPEWRLLEGRRHYLINREPHSAHLGALRAAGMQVVLEQVSYRDGGLERQALAPEFRALSERDLRCAGAHVLAVKESPAAGNP